MLNVIPIVTRDQHFFINKYSD